MPDLASEVIRLYLHLLAATIWVGGQITLVALLPTLRTLGPDAPRAAARAFNRVAWGAFAVLVITGVWSLTEIHVSDRSVTYQIVLFVKLAVVAASGIGAAIHAAGRSRLALALGGSVAGLGALIALFLGTWMHG